jgi:hypothetical protein
MNTRVVDEDMINLMTESALKRKHRSSLERANDKQRELLVMCLTNERQRRSRGRVWGKP